MMRLDTCAQCGAVLPMDAPIKTEYCSDACRQRAYRARHPKPKKPRGRTKLDLTGQTFGKLAVLKEAERSGVARRWLCRCKCGNELVVRQDKLRRGDATSCDACKPPISSACETCGERIERQAGTGPAARFCQDCHRQKKADRERRRKPPTGRRPTIVPKAWKLSG